MDHPLFRRLHRIRQNGLLYLVFPAASHSRFEHSVGVLQVASDIVDELQVNADVAAGKTTAAVRLPAQRRPGQATSLTPAEHDDLRRLVRLSGLVHDLGHGPFSHHFDPFAPQVDVLERLIKEDFAEGAYLLESLQSECDRVGHEFMSCLLLAEICRQRKMSGDQQELSWDDARAVSAVILKRPSLVPEEKRPLIRLASDIVASAPADADRMDYLLRDSCTIGVNYGLYDYNRLMKSFLPYVDPESGELRLGIKFSGLRAVENFVQARFELFVQVYYHKTNRAVQRMLQRIADTADRDGMSPFDWEQLESLYETYIFLSDDYFFRLLLGKGEHALEHSDINDIAKRIHIRRLWKRVYEGENADAVAASIDEAFPAAGAFVDTIRPKATKDLDEGASILVRGDEGVYQKKENTKWTSESSIIEALHENEKTLKRVYVTTSDPKELENCRAIGWKCEEERE